MKLTVLNVAFPFAPVGPDAVGGAEQVLSQLDHALVRAGHRSIVIACAGSRTAGTLAGATEIPATIDGTTRHGVYRRYRETIENAVARWPVDLVHFHGLDFYEYLPVCDGVPLLATLHCPASFYPAAIFGTPRPELRMQCVSVSQRRSFPSGFPFLPEIANGVSPDFLTARHAKRAFAVALGRICPEKNFHAALDAARRADLGLLLAGAVFPYPAHERYFREEIAPRLDRRRRHLGPVGYARKRRLLAAARCLLLPSTVPETSSLAAMEALACGTPVVAYRAGALPEIVEHGKTGFIVGNEREMAEAIHAAGRIDPEVCREAARTRFSLDRTVAQYLALYSAMRRKERARA